MYGKYLSIHVSVYLSIWSIVLYVSSLLKHWSRQWQVLLMLKFDCNSTFAQFFSEGRLGQWSFYTIWLLFLYSNGNCIKIINLNLSCGMIVDIPSYRIRKVAYSSDSSQNAIQEQLAPETFCFVLEAFNALFSQQRCCGIVFREKYSIWFIL